ncbi:MAG: hypothetical protein AB1551_06535 [Actinomycetota bacterium]
MPRARPSPLAGAEPLAPRKKWRAILLATLLLVPGYWSLMAGLVSVASDRQSSAPAAGPLIAFGLALVPFVFVALAFLSEHPRAPGAVLKAMGLSLVVGVPVSAIAGDAVTGLVAGLGAGGVAALRADADNGWRARALAVLVVTVCVFLLVRMVPEAALLLTPALPFTGVGVADHLSERRADRERQAQGQAGSSASPQP